MLLSALLLATIPQHGAVPFHLVIKTEARSPASPHISLIRDKRTAFDFFLLVKEGSPKPVSIKHTNWRKTNVVVVYPGLIQRDATVKLLGMKHSGKRIVASILVRRGISSETHYPMLVLTVPKLPASVKVELLDTTTTSMLIHRRRGA